MILVYTDCICHFVRTFGVRNFRTFTVHVFSFFQKIPYSSQVHVFRHLDSLPIKQAVLVAKTCLVIGSVDPDQMPQSVEFDLGVHCLLRHVCAKHLMQELTVLFFHLAFKAGLGGSVGYASGC